MPENSITIFHYMTQLNSQNQSGTMSSTTLPALFIGHGSPMNALEENPSTLEWKRIASLIPRPKAILSISAHWLTRGTYVTHMLRPKTIHDFGGFPRELSEFQYPVLGSPELAEKIANTISGAANLNGLNLNGLKSNSAIQLNEDWGLDHGTWSILAHMYPKADIPVMQLSIDIAQPPQFHYNLGKRLASLRDQGILIIGSGNIVHNLKMVEFSRINEIGFGHDWALEMREYCNKNILANNHEALIDYQKLGRAATLSVPTPEHYYPLLYILGMQGNDEPVSLFNDYVTGGGASMTSVVIGTLDPK